MAAGDEDAARSMNQSVAISNGMVKLLRQYTGRGPTKARTSVGRDYVLVVLQDTLTTGERQLVNGGYEEEVLHTRRRYQELMQTEAIDLITTLTGREVIGFMSDNHTEPDIGVEIFMLAPNGADPAIEEGDSTDS